MDEQDEVSRRWFDPATVRLELIDDVSEFFDDEALIALSGALSDSVVVVTRHETGVRLQIRHDAVVSMNRLLQRRTTGEWFVRNTKFRILHDYSGRQFAARSLVIQARAAQALGFQSIDLYAMGNYQMARSRFPQDRWSGYWVWPRLGFDGAIPPEVLRLLPAQFQDCRDVSELMQTQEGRDCWELSGDSLEAKFDLTAGSVSWQLLISYTQHRNIKV